MKLDQIVESDQTEEWTNQGPPASAYSLSRKMKSLDHQADIMMGKLETWTKVAKGKVFTATGVKSGLKLPKHVELNPRQFVSWTLIHANPNIVTKVYVIKGDPQIVLPIRALINRHNELTNARAEMEGRLAKVKAEFENRLENRTKDALAATKSDK